MYSQRPQSSANGNGNGLEIDNSKTNLIINYLPQQMTDQDFRVLFAQIGDIRSAKIIRKKATGYSYGFGFVDYLLPEDAKRAIKMLNGHLVEHKKIKVAFARPSGDEIKQANLYIRNLPPNFTEDNVQEMFSPFGQIIQCRIVADKGIGFVLFDLHEQALMAIEDLNGKQLAGASAPLVVKFANDNNQKNRNQPNPKLKRGPKSGQSYGGRGYNDSYSNMPYEGYGMSGPMRHMPHQNREHRFNPMSNVHQSYQSYQNYPSGPMGYNSNPVQPMSMPNAPPPAAPSMPMQGSFDMDNGFDADKGGYILFAYNIGPDTDEYGLGELFGHYGKVLRVNVMRKGDSGESKGFGFVTMKNYNEALNAISALNGYNYSGKPLQVSFKK